LKVFGFWGELNKASVCPVQIILQIKLSVIEMKTNFLLAGGAERLIVDVA